ncbi:hypothetical protein [Streptomyces fuscus]|nr:hypothetical protein [Streptomyces fuscus]
MLEKAGNDQLRTDDSVRAEIAKLKTEYYEGAPAVGPTKGR